MYVISFYTQTLDVAGFSEFWYSSTKRRDVILWNKITVIGIYLLIEHIS